MIHLKGQVGVLSAHCYQCVRVWFVLADIGIQDVWVGTDGVLTSLASGTHDQEGGEERGRDCFVEAKHGLQSRFLQDCSASFLNLDTDFVQHTRSDAITFKQQPKENILSADTVVIEYLGLLGG